MTNEASELDKKKAELLGIKIHCRHGKVGCEYNRMYDEGEPKKFAIGNQAGAEFETYPHDGGLEDSTGRGWWLFVSCPGCGYSISWQKLEQDIEYERDRNE